MNYKNVSSISMFKPEAWDIIISNKKILTVVESHGIY